MKPKPKRQKSRTLRFPKGFLWGAATSAYQVEGGIANNDWETQVRLPRAGAACDHYNRFEADFKLAKKLNHNAHRLSLEWSRIEPDKGKWDEEALRHYFHVLENLKNQGFTTFVTLHHFTNPVWVAKQGGWAHKKTVDDFADYVGKIAQTLGQFIDFWVTVNEPGIYAYMGYQGGFWPPFAKSILKSFMVYRNMLEGHNRAYKLIHAYYHDAKVGLAQNVSSFRPFHPRSFFDNLEVKVQEFINIDYPYRKTICDFIGLNHYMYRRIHFSLWFWKKQVVRGREAELSDKGWEIYPRAVYEVLLKLKKFGKPIYITENGIADSTDKKRPEFIRGYVKEVYHAIKRGVDVRGYLHWTLLDSYEWPVLKQEKTGYKMQFGLVKVDFKNQKRAVRKSARVYAKICKDNALTL
ncbi:MAG: glycoside hydrolase family 1 protein [Candidatus Doudnabacteria bacterium]|nr:glycoside hydrolase family 1 protein [Candidatus Doudnabacteria bacterium]